MRQFFTQKKEEGVTDLAVMKTKFIEKYINSNTVINDFLIPTSLIPICMPLTL